MNRKILVTGGAGFIGSNLIRFIISNTSYHVLNFDKLTYAGNLESLSDVADDSRYSFQQSDINSIGDVEGAIKKFQPDWIINLAAESHVDRSIDGPGEFIQTNIVGTYNLLKSARHYFQSLDSERQKIFRFHHVSTDEVFGSLGVEDPAFSESTPYDPHSPYSASKASSDHLVRAWQDTYGLPTLISNCSNNYGPFQFPEKLVPVVVLNAIHGEPIPVYGNGENVRDWLFVEDHVRALLKVVESGAVGESYNIGGGNEMQNIELVKMLCALLDEELPISKNSRLREFQKSSMNSYSDLIQFVTDRPGHDMRYAIDATKIENELGWKPKEKLQSGFRQTIQWYLHHEEWWSRILSGDYKLERQGLEQ